MIIEKGMNAEALDSRVAMAQYHQVLSSLIREKLLADLEIVKANPKRKYAALTELRIKQALNGVKPI